MNKWFGDGRITRDLSIEVGASGKEFLRFTIANDRRRDENGERKTDFIRCVAFGKLAAFIAKYFAKGDGINLSGRLESSEYTDKNGNKRTSWEITVEEAEFPKGKKATETAQSAPTEATAPNGDAAGYGNINPDDLPF